MPTNDKTPPLEVTVAVLNNNVMNLTKSVDLLQDTMFKRQDEIEARLVKEQDHLSRRIHELDDASMKLYATRASKDDLDKLEKRLTEGLALKANITDTQPIRAFVTDLVKWVVIASMAATGATVLNNQNHKREQPAHVQTQERPAPAPADQTGRTL